MNERKISVKDVKVFHSSFFTVSVVVLTVGM